MFIGVFSKATNAITAHFCFAAVRVDDTHAYVTRIGWYNDYKTIGADACATVAEADGEVCIILIGPLWVRKEDEIVAETMHFC